MAAAQPPAAPSWLPRGPPPPQSLPPPHLEVLPDSHPSTHHTESLSVDEALTLRQLSNGPCSADETAAHVGFMLQHHT